MEAFFIKIRLDIQGKSNKVKQRKLGLFPDTKIPKNILQKIICGNLTGDLS